MSARIIRGIAASSGIAIGPILHYKAARFVAQQKQSNNISDELHHLDVALAQARQEIQHIHEQARLSVNAQDASIFEAHELFLADPDLLGQVRAAIQQQAVTAAFAWQEGIAHYTHQLQMLDDDYLAARAADLEDVGQRVLRILQGQQEQSLHLQEPVIIVASDLTPSETVRFDSSKVRAFCTAVGGPTSHVAILAKALGIPAIAGLGDELEQLLDGMQVIVDGTHGEILLEPDQETRELYQGRTEALVQRHRLAFETATLPAYTQDGKYIEVVANLGSADKAAEALTYGAEGIGLLRTEFLFLERSSAPSEEEQMQIYRSMLEIMEQRPVVVRTFDIGGDKPASYMPLSVETNPFLGIRGIRLALAYPELMQTQLRALLRAGVGRNLRIMFPMVSSSEEIASLHEQVDIARRSLIKEHVAHAEAVQIGIMIEVPAAALMADLLAEQVDFFSIGTNDLTQYTLAADRTNEAVAKFADALHPAVLRLIAHVCQAAHKHNRWVGLCGELAGDPLALPVLLGLGLDELSMTPKAIPLCKQEIRSWNLAETQKIAQQVLQLRNATDVRAFLTKIPTQNS